MGQSFVLARCEPESTGNRLRFAVMVMAVVVVMCGSGERRTSKHHDQENGSENLLHAAECITMPIVETCTAGTRTK
jgi:hypothetical protein